MRCPKCKFFSFDDLATCAKCSKDLSAVAEELHGTCTEVKLPFFLSSVIESPEPEEQAFSESQALPLTDDTDVSFDDTLSGGGISLSLQGDETMLAGLDETIDVSDDELSLEVGDIMPIDLDQFDEPIDLEDDSAFGAASGLSLDSDDEIVFGDDIDLNFTDDLSDQIEDHDATEILSKDDFEDDIDLDLTGDFDEGGGLDLSEDFDSFDLDETSMPLEPVSDDGGFNAGALAGGESLDLDEDLLATLTGDFPAISSDETEALEFDDSLLAELKAGSEEGQFGTELPADMGDDLADFDLDETSIALEPISGAESFEADDTLSIADLPLEDFEFETEDEELSFDDTLSGELDLDLVELEPEQPEEEVALGDSTLEGLAFDSEDEEPALDDTLSEELDLDLDELEPEQPEEEVALGDTTLEGLAFDDTLSEELDLGVVEPEAEVASGDTTLESLAFDSEDEELPADELLAASDTELEFDLVEPEAEPAEAELTLGESSLEELAFDLEDEELPADELLATSASESEVDFAVPEAEQPAVELTEGESSLEELAFDTEDEEQLGDELLASMDDELDLDLGELDPEQQDEDMVLDASHLEELEPRKTPSLGLEEIDVSDLLSPSEGESQASSEGEEIDLTSLMEEDLESHDSDLDLLDDDMPEIELIEED